MRILPRLLSIIPIFLSIIMAASVADAAAPEKVSAAVAKEKGCLSCHQGIERFSEGPMMETIEAMGADFADPGGCVVCHGGTPGGTTKELAHAGAPKDLADADGPHMFFPDPGSVWIADKTCGQCHDGYAERLRKSLMNTEAGKLQGNFWSWGLQEDYKVVWGNYDQKDEDGPTPAVGTDAYKAYMTAMVGAHPDQFPSEMKQPPVVDVNAIPDHPNLAGITYSRQQCQRCHVGVSGREKRGDYRGSGCSSCHVPTPTKASTRAAIRRSTARFPESC